MTFDEWQKRIEQSPRFDKADGLIVPEDPRKKKDFGADNKWKEESMGDDEI